jgi:hypothetical protein
MCHDTLRSRIRTFAAAADTDAATLLDAVNRAATASGGDGQDILLSLHALELSGLRTGGRVRLDARAVARRDGAALAALGRERAWATAALQHNLSHGASNSLILVGHGPSDVVHSSVEDLVRHTTQPDLPPTATAALQALVTLRTANGATCSDLAFDTTTGRTPVTTETIREWAGRLGPQLGIATPRTRASQRPTTPLDRLRRLGIEYRDA